MSYQTAKQTILLSGGDPRLCRITGGGCMLSALCALFCCSEASAFEAASTAGQLWKEISEEAGKTYRSEWRRHRTVPHVTHGYDRAENIIFPLVYKNIICNRRRTTMKKKTVLTIAGSDSSGGAGIQADIKAITMNGVYASSVITALTAQNTTGVYGILETSADFIAAQMDAVFSDIFPDAVKIGMLPSPEAMECVAAKLRQYKPEHIVLDPVMVSTSGHRLMEPEAEETLQAELFPLAELITPNIPEAEVLTELLIG